MNNCYDEIEYISEPIKCDICGAALPVAITCPYCGKKFCTRHHLPWLITPVSLSNPGYGHNCEYVPQKKPRK